MKYDIRAAGQWLSQAYRYADTRTHACAHTQASTQVHQTRDDYPKMHMGKHAVQTINKHTILIISHKSKYMHKVLSSKTLRT